MLHPVSLTCGHSGCKDCIEELVKIRGPRSRCPVYLLYFDGKLVKQKFFPATNHRALPVKCCNGAVPKIGNRVPERWLLSDRNPRKHGHTRCCVSKKKGTMSRMQKASGMGSITGPPDSGLSQRNHGMSTELW